LIDCRYSACQRGSGGACFEYGPIKRYVTAVRAQAAGQNTGEGALARSIFSDQAMDFAVSGTKIYLSKSYRPPETLGYGLGSEHPVSSVGIPGSRGS
jgi:hypothetical protein